MLAFNMFVASCRCLCFNGGEAWIEPAAGAVGRTLCADICDALLLQPGRIPVKSNVSLASISGSSLLGDT